VGERDVGAGFDEGEDLVLDEVGVPGGRVSYSRPRSLPCASPPPLPMEMAIMVGSLWVAMRLSRTVKRRWSGPSAPMMKGARVPGTYCAGT
jgi:hypothetical protein